MGRKSKYSKEVFFAYYFNFFYGMI